MRISDDIDREMILASLKRLNDLLAERGVIGELCIFGGAAMVLPFDARDSTRDVGAIFVPKTAMTETAWQVGKEMVIRPTAEYLLAMKCLASRLADYEHPGDKRDVVVLVKHLSMTDPATVCDLVVKYYKERVLPPRVRYSIEETMSEISSGS